jgi:3-oxoacyl-[acyl-carrier-protein] synthase-3
MSTLRAAGITGLGMYLPERILTNHELAEKVDTNDEWIRSRTGIAERRIAAPEQFTVDLAENAARAALEDAKVLPDQLQLIIVATCTEDYQFPSTAALLQNRLGASCGAFDLSAACSGFAYALVTAWQFVATGAYDTILVVAAETMSRILDWNDRSTCILFGDGAGAAVVQRVPDGFGVLGFDLGADGSGGDLLKASCRLHPETGESQYVVQNGREVYKFAVNVMGESAVRAVEKASLAPTEIDLLVPHQANIRIIEAAAKRLDLPMEKVFVNLQKYGNTSAASIPIALTEARDEGRLKYGDNLVVVGFGGGLTWASAAIKWYDKSTPTEPGA